MTNLNATPSFKKILVPMDGSPASIKAARYAMHLAELEDAELVVVHVLEDIKQGGAIGLQARYGNLKIIQGFKKAREASAEKWISPILEAAKQKGLSVKSDILSDDGSSEAGVIVKYVEKNNIDLIVIGSRGQSKFKSLLVGSVTNTVLNHVNCPVMIVR